MTAIDAITKKVALEYPLADFWCDCFNLVTSVSTLCLAKRNSQTTWLCLKVTLKLACTREMDDIDIALETIYMNA